MPAIIAIGTQRGDEAKARIVDYLAKDADAVVRNNGGANAGHTVEVGNEKIIFHLIPAGLLQPKVSKLVLGRNMVIRLDSLVKEIQLIKQVLAKTALTIEERILIAGAAHVTLPYHIALEAARKRIAANNDTTLQGISTTYEYKHAYRGVRIYDLFQPVIVKEKLDRILPEANAVIKFLNPQHQKFTTEQIMEHIYKYFPDIGHMVGDEGNYLEKLLKADKKIIIEGAQGVLLSIDEGTYPYVSSSNGTASGILVGLGISLYDVISIIGVVKAYPTRVGGGYMVTQMNPEDDAKTRLIGNEIGATTGRDRYCGWPDFLAWKRVAKSNGLDYAAMTKIDVFDDYETIKVCVAYKDKTSSRIIEEFPDDPNLLFEYDPVYEEIPGWNNTKNCRTWRDLDPNAKRFVELYEEVTGVSVALISVGAERNKIIVRSELR